MQSPSASVIIAVLDEAGTIEAVLDDLLAQDYDGVLEIVVADGGSHDGTRDQLTIRQTADPRILVIDNPGRRQSAGLNLAAEHATGEILIRADGHTRYGDDYIRCSVNALQETEAIAAGGPMNPAAEGRFAAMVAGAMNSPMVLPARFHHAEERERVDTVYLGAFRRSDFLDLGGFRSFPSGTSEDADLYTRWRTRGEAVIVDPRIRTTYTPRGSPAALWKQYFRYGMGKAEMLWANGRFPSLRPLAPVFLVVGLVVLAVLAILTGVWWPLVAVGAVWLAGLLFVGLRSPAPAAGVAAAAAIMHLSYGLGVLWGLVRGPGPVRRAIDS